MPRKKSTWQEKLQDSKGHPTISKVTGKMSRRFGEGTMVIPAPIEVDALMKTVRKRRLITIDRIREKLAAEHQVDFACPMTTGIFAWIAAHAADEAEQAGKKRITPYWRTLKAKGELNPKYPGGVENVRTRLEAEGHTVIQIGKRYFVEDYEAALVK